MRVGGVARGVLLVCAVFGCGVLPAAAQAADDPAWARQALELQQRVADDVGFDTAPWVGTHNSFNSIAEMGVTLSALDSNQRITLTDQLDEGMRSLELDLHMFPTVRGEIGMRPVVCHATDPDIGCTIEKPFRQVLGEIAGWLRAPAHRDAVLLLYLEDALRTPAGHAEAADAITDVLGPLLYKPPSGKCSKLPLKDLSRADIRKAGAQVIAVASRCGQGPAWPALVYDWSGHDETRPVGFRDYPNCGPDFKRADYTTKLVRYFEDSTALTRTLSLVGAEEADDGITPATTAAMQRCGVDLIGFDQVAHNDQRVAAAIWSWAPGQPSGPWHCAVQRVDAAAPNGRWYAQRCASRRRPLCRRGDRWLIPAKKVDAHKALRSCRKLKARSAVPRTGYEAQLVREKMARRGASEVWLGYRLRNGGWNPLDPR